MTVIRKRTGDKGGCCSPYSELQLEIERVNQTAIEAKTTANDTEAYLNTINGKVNEAIAVVPQVQTNTEAIAAHGAELTDHDARIHTNTIINDQQNTDIAALKTKTNDNAAAIEALENEVGPETVAGTIQYRLHDIDTKLPTAIKEVEMIANASTVTHKATHISGTAESDALPVVSREQAGIMSASVYAAMEDVIANNTSRISVLEQSAPTYDISGLVGPNPTNAEISAAFTQKYPSVPIQAGLRAADYDNAHFWQYGKNTWILLTQIDVQTASNDSLGVVKGSNADGKIFVETDGSMSLKGYDALVSKDATHDSKISTLETGLGNANARIDATNTNVANNAAAITAANGNISTNTNDITSLKGRMATAEGQIATHETKIDQHTQSINGLTTDVNGLKTDVSGLKTDVNGLNTDVNGLNTSKQDKLIAGEGITIASDGKTISADSSKPIVRVVSGKNAMLDELKKFLSQGEFGDTYEMIFEMGNAGAEVYRPPVEKSFFRFGVVDDYFFLEPATALRIVDRRVLGDVTYVTASCIGNLRYYPLEGSMMNENGVIYLTVGNLIQFRFNVCKFTNLRDIATGSLTGEVILGISPHEELKDPKAIVNYEPKP